jgi:protein-L-isoaspartate(D-aspartate) O-methyltransferase
MGCVADDLTRPDRFGWWLAGAAAVLMLGFLAFGGRSGGTGDFAAQRERMVDEQIRARGVVDPAVLRALRRVPRHEFVPAAHRGQAYADYPLPIGFEQTISQPYIVAYMTEALGLRGGQRALEIGTGSGYQAAVLAEIGIEVYTIEIVEPLGLRAAETLKRLGYQRVHTRIGDGYRGWPAAAPFDGIIVTAAPAAIPAPLAEQLAEGGRMVIPVGRHVQDLKVLKKRDGRLVTLDTLPVRFVPMTGEAAR